MWWNSRCSRINFLLVCRKFIIFKLLHSFSFPFHPVHSTNGDCVCMCIALMDAYSFKMEQSINHFPFLLYLFADLDNPTKKNIIHKTYWFFYTIATVYSFIITVMYWTVVYDPGKSMHALISGESLRGETNFCVYLCASLSFGLILCNN